MVARTTRHPSSERADGSANRPSARSLDVCLDNDGPFIDVETLCSLSPERGTALLQERAQQRSMAARLVLAVAADREVGHV
jgi:hypothetical protein